uniref:Ubiquitin-like domain-containing protein n=1 Tax=viral metagenome TaxID=1070528 RepID=A0A6C0HZJ0_9ZZZZ
MDILTFTDVFVSQKTIEAFTIQIKTATGRFHRIDVTPSMTVLELKLQIQKVEMYEPDQQRIVYSGKQLSDDKQLKDYPISDDATLHLIVRLRGGMFHETSSRKDMELLECTLWKEINDIEKLLNNLKKMN